jgi:N-acetylmuramoyl-L-alanine amidase
MPLSRALSVTDLPSPNLNARPAPPDLLVLHYTGMKTAAEAIERLRDPIAKVSSHYVVDEDGTIFRLVAEQDRAWHAGVSYWRGRKELNDTSIGIEIVNPGHEWGYRPFPAAQIAAVTALCTDIISRHAIKPRNVVAHSDIAPTRKQDPGELFPWAGLAEAGIGIWAGGDGSSTDRGLETPAALGTMLTTIGYDVQNAPLGALLTAFQRHWRQETVNGLPDAGTVLRMHGLIRMLAGTT